MFIAEWCVLCLLEADALAFSPLVNFLGAAAMIAGDFFDQRPLGGGDYLCLCGQADIDFDRGKPPVDGGHRGPLPGQPLLETFDQAMGDAIPGVGLSLEPIRSIDNLPAMYRGEIVGKRGQVAALGQERVGGFDI